MGKRKKKKGKRRNASQRMLPRSIMYGLFGSIATALLGIAISWYMTDRSDTVLDIPMSDDPCKRGIQQWGLNHLDHALDSFAVGIARLRKSAPHAAFCRGLDEVFRGTSPWTTFCLRSLRSRPFHVRLLTLFFIFHFPGTQPIKYYNGVSATIPRVKDPHTGKVDLRAMVALLAKRAEEHKARQKILRDTVVD